MVRSSIWRKILWEFKDILINWKFPSAGRIKINTDGSSVDHGWGSFDGLSRDDQGRWLEGFCGRIDYAPPLTAELWRIRRYLKLAKERNWKRMIIEIDSEVATDLIHPCDIENHPEKVLIQDCRNLIDEMEASVIHTLREGNRCDDILAKMGINQGEQDIKINVPPIEIVEALKADLIRASFPCGF